MNLPLLALAISAFCIGTTEFVILGLLPNVAHDLRVTLSAAGLLVAGYALGVAVGAPIMALLTARLPRKAALLVLMGLFVLGNGLCAASTQYVFLMAARVIAALCHGAFFGIGSVEAANLVTEDKKASAVATMFMGLTLATVLGVPLGTALGQAEGWRATFWVVSGLGVVAWVALAGLLPADKAVEQADFGREMRVLRVGAVWTVLSVTVLVSASLFALFTYIAPILTAITHVSPRGISATLLSIGVGLTVGNAVGGKLADWNLGTALLGATALLCVTSLLFFWADEAVVPAEIVLFLWGAAYFAAANALQVTAMNVGKGAPGFISTLNISAFNVGNALGAWAGGRVLNAGLGLRSVPLAAVAFSVVGLLVAAQVFRQRPVVSVTPLRGGGEAPPPSEPPPR